MTTTELLVLIEKHKLTLREIKVLLVLLEGVPVAGTTGFAKIGLGPTDAYPSLNRLADVGLATKQFRKGWVATV